MPSNRRCSNGPVVDLLKHGEQRIPARLHGAFRGSPKELVGFRYRPPSTRTQVKMGLPARTLRLSCGTQRAPLRPIALSRVQLPSTAAISPRAAKNRTLPASLGRVRPQLQPPPSSPPPSSPPPPPLHHHHHLLLLHLHLRLHHHPRLHPALTAAATSVPSPYRRSRAAVYQPLCPRSPSTLRTSRTSCSTCTASCRTSSAARPSRRATPLWCAAGLEGEGGVGGANSLGCRSRPL